MKIENKVAFFLSLSYCIFSTAYSLEAENSNLRNLPRNEIAIRAVSVAETQVFKKLRQNYRPFSACKVEYTVSNEDSKGNFKLYARHSLLKDMEQGFFKDMSVELEDVKDPSAGMFIRGTSWDGEKTLILDFIAPYNSNLDISGYRPANANANILVVPALDFCMIWRLFEAAFSDRSLYSKLENIGEKDGDKFEFHVNNDGVCSLVIDGGIALKINMKNGVIIEKSTLIKEKETNISSVFYSLKVNKWCLKDGFVFPLEVIYQEPDDLGGHRISQKYSIIEKSIKINPKITKKDFLIDLPVGTRVIDSILKINYTITELDNVEKQDDFIIKTKKILSEE